MTDRGGSGRAVGRTVIARAAADKEAARLAQGLQPALSALSAIGDAARWRSRYSARARVLELEVLPAAPQLGVRLRELRSGLAAGSPAEASARVEAVAATLQQLLDVTALVDVPGELGLPLELVGTVQSGLLAGLASVARLREFLATPVVAAPVAAGPARVDAVPAGPATWVARTASGLLPPGSRERYAEEFAGELRALAEAGAGSRAQLGHAVRQLATVWALRRALRPAAPRPAEPERARAPRGGVHGGVHGGAHGAVPARPPDPLRAALDRWLTRREARRVLREQARTQHAESTARTAFPPPRARHRHRR